MTEPVWELEVAAPAVRDLDRLPAKYAHAIVEFFGALAANPKRVGKPLRFDLEGTWSARRGPYRIVYSLDEEARKIFVLALAHRADVYRPR